MSGIKVFLVEDEMIIRNGVKRSIDWEKEGYEFVGEASDGELAYPLILKEKPDIMITDIRMPFMDGLELSRLVKTELPNIKILILSGYDEFQYAKEAIKIGVTDYLLKPISSAKLLEALGQVKENILQEREEKELLLRYSRDMQENTENEKSKLFDRLMIGEMSMGEAVEEGKKFGLNLSASCYAVCLFKILMNSDEKEFRRHVAVQAGIEIGFERFLEEKNYQAIVTHFGDLGGLKQLPGLAIQRLMEKGYGFGAEGDWKTAAMVRVMKVMTQGMKDAKGTSFMEDYTYNLVPGKEGILQAHMLEVCPTISDGPISIKCQPLSMGDREDPARLVFTSKTGPAVATSLIDLGDRFRLIINDVECKKVEKPMPKLPVATAFWTPQPDLRTGAEAWILAGGAHHTAFSYDLTAEQMGDWAEAMGIEAVYIDKDTTIRQFKNELMWNSVAYRR